MGYKWKLLNETSRKVLQRGLTQQGGMCPFLFCVPLFSPWNLGLMAGAPVAILDHEIILKIEATHIKGGEMDRKNSSSVSGDCRATTPA